MKNKQLGRQTDRMKISKVAAKTACQTSEEAKLFLGMADRHLDRQTRVMKQKIPDKKRASRTSRIALKLKGRQTKRQPNKHMYTSNKKKMRKKFSLTECNMHVKWLFLH
jgi:hypothetical protein